MTILESLAVALTWFYCILGGCFEVGRLVAGQAAVRLGQGQQPFDEGL